jgi:hypothetical protein
VTGQVCLHRGNNPKPPWLSPSAPVPQSRSPLNFISEIKLREPDGGGASSYIGASLFVLPLSRGGCRQKWGTLTSSNSPRMLGLVQLVSLVGLIGRLCRLGMFLLLLGFLCIRNCCTLFQCHKLLFDPI